MYELNVTQDGMDAMLKLRELRQLWHQIGQFEDLLGREAYGEIETAMLKSMQSYERSEERRVGKECRCRWSP